MADTVSKTELLKGVYRYVVHLTNQSDGTGESAVAKITVADLTVKDGPGHVTASNVTIDRIEGSVSGFDHVLLEWDHTANDEIAVLAPGYNCIDFMPVGGKPDPKSAGGTGNVVLTTKGGGAGSSYDIVIYARGKK